MTIYLHELIWEGRRGPIPPGWCVRHIDGDFLNNLDCNLELALGGRPGPLGEYVVADDGAEASERN